ncbi:glycerophosphodiester phosphodiesterase family protein [Lentilactobacillus kefiri]|uniref:glycerophosphodiester phosphodiesterase family protein n=1 Tax=Lentilactobacillus kefiri TaxID=33962 RepID=UPI00345E99D4
MGKNETKLYYYLTGVFICLALVLRRFLSTYQSFTIVVFCTLVMFLGLMALFYYGLTSTAHKRVNKHLSPIVAILVSSVYLFGLLIPLGLFGFSNFLKFGVPISGAQFTWITVNRYAIAITAIVVYFVFACFGIWASHYLLNVIRSNQNQPLQVLKRTVKATTLKSFSRKLAIVLSMLVGVCLLIVGLAWINQYDSNTVMFFLSKGMIDILAPFAEIVIISRLLGIELASFSPTPLLTMYALGLVIFAGLFAAVSPVYANPPMTKPTIIVHRGVINQNAVGNTIASLKRNSQYHFPFIEMDIQETKNHQFICAHDNDLRIPKKGNVEIDQLSLKTIKRYHHVDMFGDYLRIANKLKQPLIIELKVTNHSDQQMGTRFAKQFKPQLTVLPHRVHSIGYPFLRQVKRQIPGMDIGLVTMLNFGNIGHYHVDFYTLQHLTANPFLISSVGETGRPVYSWTDDSKLSMVRMEMLGTTGQVTDQAFRLQHLRVNYRRDRWILLLNSLQNYL